MYNERTNRTGENLDLEDRIEEHARAALGQKVMDAKSKIAEYENLRLEFQRREKARVIAFRGQAGSTQSRARDAREHFEIYGQDAKIVACM